MPEHTSTAFKFLTRELKGNVVQLVYWLICGFYSRNYSYLPAVGQWLYEKFLSKSQWRDRVRIGASTKGRAGAQATRAAAGLQVKNPPTELPFDEKHR